MIVRELATKISFVIDEATFNVIQDKIVGLAGKMQELGAKATALVSLPLGLAGKSMLSYAGDVERGMNVLGSNLTASTEDLDALKEKAKDLAVDFGRSSFEVIQSMTSLAKMGKDSGQIMASLEPIMQMATIGTLSLDQAAEQLSATLSMFNLKAEDSNMVVDKMVAAADASAGDIRDFGMAMSYAGSQSSAMGNTLDDTLVMLAMLSNLQIKGERAGTGLRGMFTDMIKPTGRANAVLEKLGVSLKDSEGNFKKTLVFLRELKEANASSEDLGNIFDTTNMPAVGAIMKQLDAEKEIRKTVEENSKGSASKKVAELMKGLNGALERLSAAFLNFKDALASSGLLQAVTFIVKVLTLFFAILSNLPTPILFIISMIGVIIFMIGPLLLILGTLLKVLFSYRLIMFLLPFLKYLKFLFPGIAKALLFLSAGFLKAGAAIKMLSSSLGFIGNLFLWVGRVLKALTMTTIIWAKVTAFVASPIFLTVAAVLALIAVMYGLYGIFTGEENFMSKFFKDAWAWIVKCWEMTKSIFGLFQDAKDTGLDLNATSSINNTSSPAAVARSEVIGAGNANTSITTPIQINVPPGTSEEQAKYMANAVKKSTEDTNARAYRHTLANNPALE